MRIAIGAVCIENGQILLVKKGEFWILPGGKPNENEFWIDCLKREISEELPNVQVKVISKYDTFEGITPHKGDSLRCVVYFTEIEGEIRPAAEISEAAWVTNPLDINLSDITRKIILKLQSDGYL